MRKAALETLIHSRDGCTVPQSLPKAILLCTNSYRKMPNVVFSDPEDAMKRKAYLVLLRLNGDTFVLFGDRDDPTKDATLQCHDSDDILQREWIYPSLQRLWQAVQEWQLDQEDRPCGWVRASRRNHDGEMVQDVSMLLH